MHGMQEEAEVICSGVSYDDYEIVDATNWFFINCVLHPEDVHEHVNHAARQTGSEDVSIETLMLQTEQACKSVIQRTLQTTPYASTTINMILPPIAPGMPPSMTAKNEMVLAFKVELIGRRHEAFNLWKSHCMDPMQKETEMMAELADAARKFARTLPADVALQLRRDHRMTVKIDGEDAHGEFGKLISYGWSREAVTIFGRNYGFGDPGLATARQTMPTIQHQQQNRLPLSVPMHGMAGPALQTGRMPGYDMGHMFNSRTAHMQTSWA